MSLNDSKNTHHNVRFVQKVLNFRAIYGNTH